MNGGKRRKDLTASGHIELVLHLQRRGRSGADLHPGWQRRIGQRFERQLRYEHPCPGQRAAERNRSEKEDPGQHARNSAWLFRLCHLLSWVTKRADGLQYLSARLRHTLSMCKAIALSFPPAISPATAAAKAEKNARIEDRQQSIRLPDCSWPGSRKITTFPSFESIRACSRPAGCAWNRQRQPHTHRRRDRARCPRFAASDVRRR